MKVSRIKKILKSLHSRKRDKFYGQILVFCISQKILGHKILKGLEPDVPAFLASSLVSIMERLKLHLQIFIGILSIFNTSTVLTHRPV